MKLKCDEKRPACSQCVRRGKDCPGYKIHYRWSTKYEVSKSDDIESCYWPQNEHNALVGVLPNAQLPDNHPPTVMTTIQNEKPSVDYSTTALATISNLEADSANNSAGISAACGIVGALLDSQQDDVETAFENDGTGFEADALSLSGESHPEILSKERITDLEMSSRDGGTGQLWDNLDWPGDWPTDVELVTPSPNLLASTQPKILYTPIDIPTMLIEHWFTNVCPMWSAFDSPKNLHRQIAWRTWQQSEAVFYALQSMSAACLMDSLPHVKRTVGILSTKAVEAIQRGTAELESPEIRARRSLPSDLLLAIFAMGTSVCWSDTRQLGLWFLSKARGLLSQYENNGPNLQHAERKELLHFRDAMVYWEMLSQVIGSDAQGALASRREMCKLRLSQPGNEKDCHRQSSHDFGVENLNFMDQNSYDSSCQLSLHPWTGVSTSIQHKFGLVILLCREHRLGSKKRGIGTSAALSEALVSIQLAQDLEGELMAAKFDSMSYQVYELFETSPTSDTGDQATPVSHLVGTAEAYRLAALLQLYQTFPDLEVKSIIDDPMAALTTIPDEIEAQTEVQREQALLALTLRLIETLQYIPAESGTRCIQPILYISAATGLKFDTIAGMAEGAKPNVEGSTLDNMANSRLSAGTGNKPRQSSKEIYESTGTGQLCLQLTKCTMEVSRARRFVVDRLCALQRSLPPRPIAVALDLVKAIWAEYDHNDSFAGQGHWIDIMVDKGLQTLFG